MLEVLGSPFADETVLVNEGSRVARREKDIRASLGRIYSPIMINVLIWGNVARMFFVEIVSLERMGERFQLKKLMASIPFVFETVSFVDSSPLRRRKFLLGRRERLLRNCVTFLSVPSYRTAPRLKHRCTEKKKRGKNQY